MLINYLNSLHPPLSLSLSLSLPLFYTSLNKDLSSFVISFTGKGFVTAGRTFLSTKLRTLLVEMVSVNIVIFYFKINY